MSGTSVPWNVETLVEWCCHEIEANGASVVGGTQSHLEAGVAGLYRFSATLPFEVEGDNLQDFVSPDDTIQLNQATETGIVWNSLAQQNLADLGLTAPYPSLVNAPFVLEATIQFDGGDPSESILVWFRHHFADGTSAELNARAVVTFDAAGMGYCTITATATSGVGDWYEVLAISNSGGPVGVVTANADYSHFLIRRADLPITRAAAWVYDSAGNVVGGAPASFAEVSGYAGTLVLDGIVPLEAGGQLVATVTTDIGSGLVIGDYGHAEMNWIGPASEWSVCATGG